MGRTAAQARARKARATGARKAEPLVNPFAARHGDYREEPMPVTAGELGSTTGGNVRVLRNRGGTPIDRWEARGDLSLRCTGARTCSTSARNASRPPTTR